MFGGRQGSHLTVVTHLLDETARLQCASAGRSSVILYSEALNTSRRQECKLLTSQCGPDCGIKDAPMSIQPSLPLNHYFQVLRNTNKQLSLSLDDTAFTAPIHHPTPTDLHTSNTSLHQRRQQAHGQAAPDATMPITHCRCGTGRLGRRRPARRARRAAPAGSAGGRRRRRRGRRDGRTVRGVAPAGDTAGGREVLGGFAGVGGVVG